MLWSSLVVFLFAVAIDWMYVAWSRAANLRLVLQGTLAAAGIQLLGVLSVLLYVQSPWLCIPNVFGHTLGTFIAIKYGKDGKDKREPAAVLPNDTGIA